MKRIIIFSLFIFNTTIFAESNHNFNIFVNKDIHDYNVKKVIPQIPLEPSKPVEPPDPPEPPKPECKYNFSSGKPISYILSYQESRYEPHWYSYTFIWDGTTISYKNKSQVFYFDGYKYYYNSRPHAQPDDNHKSDHYNICRIKI